MLVRGGGPRLCEPSAPTRLMRVPSRSGPAYQPDQPDQVAPNAQTADSGPGRIHPSRVIAGQDHGMIPLEPGQPAVHDGPHS